MLYLTHTVLNIFRAFSQLSHVPVSFGTDVVVISNNDLDLSNLNRAGALFLRAPLTCSKATWTCAQLQETLLPFPSDTGLTSENLTSVLTSERHGVVLTISSSVWVAGSNGCTAFTPGSLSSHHDTINPSSLLPALCTNSAPLTRSNVTSYDTTRQIDIPTPKAGILRGFRDKFTWRFLGIKYAESTTGKGRFQSPKALGVSSDTVRTALAYGPYCAQAPAVDNGYMWYNEEDCLSLNVYSPIATSGTTLDAIPKLPVMFYIHGGALNSGDSGPCPYNMTIDGYIGNSISNVYDGTNLVSYGGVVLVTINYRLNAFGWFNASNAALKDVLLALHWVQDNIEAFGGDPTKVLVWGQSGGAFMTRYLIGTNPRYTEGLFSAAIVQSDFSTSSPFYSPALALNASLNLAKDVGCASNSAVLSDHEVTCMQDLPALNLVRGTNVGELGIPWDISVDGDYVLDDIEGSIRNGAYARVPTLWSNIECETCNFLPSTLSPTEPPLTYVRMVSSAFTPTQAAKILNATMVYPYETATGEGGLSGAMLTLTRLLTDWATLCPSKYLARLESNSTDLGNAYHTLFGVGLASPFTQNWNLCRNQVCHGDDLYWVFGTAETDGLHQPLTMEQIDVMREVMKRWTEMAWNGSPNYEGAEVIWEPCGGGKEGVVNMTTSVGNGYRAAQCDFIANQLGLVYGDGTY